MWHRAGLRSWTQNAPGACAIMYQALACGVQRNGVTACIALQYQPQLYKHECSHRLHACVLGRQSLQLSTRSLVAAAPRARPACIFALLPAGRACWLSVCAGWPGTSTALHGTVRDCSHHRTLYRRSLRRGWGRSWQLPAAWSRLKLLLLQKPRPRPSWL